MGDDVKRYDQDISGWKPDTWTIKHNLGGHGVVDLHIPGHDAFPNVDVLDENTILLHLSETPPPGSKVRVTR